MTEPAPPDLSKRDIRRRRSLAAQTVIRLFGRTGAVVGGLWVGLTALLAIWAPFLANSAPLAWKTVGEDGVARWSFPLFELLTPQDVMLIVGFLLALGLALFYRVGGRLFWVWLAPMCVTVLCAGLFVALSDLGAARTEFGAALKQLAEVQALGQPDRAYQVAVDDQRWAVTAWWIKHLFVWSLLVGSAALALYKLRSALRWLGVSAALSALTAVVLLSPMLRVEKSVPSYDTYRVATLQGKVEKAYYTPIPYSPLDRLRNPKVTPIKSVNLAPGWHPTEPDIATDMQLFVEGQSGYNIRLSTLDQAEGRQATIPRTTAQAKDAADRLWQAYQQSPNYNPVAGRIKHKKVQERLDELASTPQRTRFHVMGTTGFGEDLASRMIHGSRIALVIGFISTSIAVLIGVIIGGVLGYFAGWVDLIGLRLVEIFASIPVIMLLIMIVAFYGRSLILMMVVLGLTGWVGYAYFVRAEFLKLRNMDYVMAARATGTPLHLILFRHMLPNGVAPVLVGASFGIAGAIMTEATLSFLGLGLVEEPSWGQMLNQAREGGSFDWWLAIFPGMAIFLTVFAYNLIGEALRDVIDPRAVK